MRWPNTNQILQKTCVVLLVLAAMKLTSPDASSLTWLWTVLGINAAYLIGFNQRGGRRA